VAVASNYSSVRRSDHVEEQIGKVAGSIWKALRSEGELSVEQLKRKVAAKTPVFDWAIGWLAREDKIFISSHNHTTTVRLREGAAQ
jgi:hypothetical protein